MLLQLQFVSTLLMDIIKRRPDFKVIFVSATVDIDLFTDYFKRIGLGDKYSLYTLEDSKPPYTRTIVQEKKKIDPNNLVDVVYNRINSIIQK